MSRLPAVRSNEVVRVAKRLGFIFDRQKGSHAIYYRNDKKRLVIPMHNTDLKPGTLHGLIKDMGMTTDEFAKLL